MKTRHCKALCIAVTALFTHGAIADTTLHVYVGGANHLPEPKTWDQPPSEAKTAPARERDASLQGLSIQGANRGRRLHVPDAIRE